jgi:hypothetical protein
MIEGELQNLTVRVLDILGKAIIYMFRLGKEQIRRNDK